MNTLPSMFTFEIIDVVIFIGICQGLFLSLTIQRISNNNKKANTILSVLIIISTLMLVGRFLMVRFFSEWVFLWSMVFDIVIYLFGPLFYLYTKRLLFKEEETIQLNWIHFLPAALFAILVSIYLIRYTPGDYFQAFRDGKLTLMFNLVIVTGMLSNIYYLVRSFGLLLKFKRTEKSAFSFQQSPVRYLWFFLVAISFILLGWLVGFLDARWLSGYLNFLGYDAVWIAIPVFIYMIGYFSLRQPELFRIKEKKNQSAKKSRLSHAEVHLLQEKLDSLMHNERIFLQSTLTLATVAEKIHTTTNNLSWLLNNAYDTTFYDFINCYRVKEFIKKIDNGEHLRHTILALSMDVGFNSKSTFNKAFKTEMNDTPSNFIRKRRAA